MASNYVVLIGAANIDVQGFSSDRIIQKDSNPGEIRLCSGGVSRNIAENLSSMGIGTELVSAVGNDFFGSLILEQCRSAGIGIDNTLIDESSSSSVYMAIMDNAGDMALALSDMSISKKIDIVYLKSISRIIEESAIMVFDTCLSPEVMKYLLTEYRGKRIYVDPVSVGKARGLKAEAGGVHTLKMNGLEAEYLSGMKITGEDDLNTASGRLLEMGTTRIFITLGGDGVFYRTSDEKGIFKPPAVKIRNATGAGDAFMAGIIYSDLNGFDMEHTVRFASGAAHAALISEDTVNPRISPEYIESLTGEQFK